MPSTSELTEIPAERDTPITVGILTKRAGISVRTLHYYDEIGLLSPSERSASGRRRYSTADVARLQQILSLRQLGFPLDDIGRLLGSAEFTLARVLELHAARLRDALVQQQELLRRLEQVMAAIGGGGLPPGLFARPNELVAVLAEFIKPFTATNDIECSLKPATNGVTVTWTMTGNNNFVFKAFGLFVNVDRTIGKEFESGPAALKRLCEQEATQVV